MIYKNKRKVMKSIVEHLHESLNESALPWSDEDSYANFWEGFAKQISSMKAADVIKHLDSEEAIGFVKDANAKDLKTILDGVASYIEENVNGIDWEDDEMTYMFTANDPEEFEDMLLYLHNEVADYKKFVNKLNRSDDGNVVNIIEGLLIPELIWSLCKEHKLM